MKNVNIIRAWKDAEYRNSLSAEERAALPENPAGLVELPDAEMAEVGGAGQSFWTGTCGSVCDVLTPMYNCKRSGGSIKL